MGLLKGFAKLNWFFFTKIQENYNIYCSLLCFVYLSFLTFFIGVALKKYGLVFRDAKKFEEHCSRFPSPLYINRIAKQFKFTNGTNVDFDLPLLFRLAVEELTL